MTGPFSIGSPLWPGLSKLLEEAGEVIQVGGKLIATGGSPEHWSGENLRVRMAEELADLTAACMFFATVNNFGTEGFQERITDKIRQFWEWQHEQGSDTVPDAKQLQEARFNTLLEAAQAAYWHLDRYGFVESPTLDIDILNSQREVFEKLRPFCPLIPGRL